MIFKNGCFVILVILLDNIYFFSLLFFYYRFTMRHIMRKINELLNYF